MMTDNEKKHHGIMFSALQKISLYMKVEEIREGSEDEYGLEFEEALEMAYENMQSEAINALEMIKKIPLPV